MSFLRALVGFKERIITQNSSSSEIIYELAMVIERRWNGIKDYFSEDISLQLSEQVELLCEVSRIHRKEAAKNVGAMLQRNRSFKDIFHTLHCEKADAQTLYAAHRIYAIPEIANARFVIVGDTHADSIAVKEILVSTEFFASIERGEKVFLIFLGDYVDRGHDPLGLLDWVLALKFLFPLNVILLKGNHEGGYIENNGIVRTPYRIPEEDDLMDYFPPFLRRIEQQNHHVVNPVLKEYLAFFEGLSIIAVFQSGGKVFMCCHGGIPRPNIQNASDEQWFDYLPSLASLTADELDCIGRSTIQNLMWSDPTEDESDLKWDTGRYKFTENHFDVFCDTFGVDVFFRGHEEEKDGVRTFFDTRLVTVFSSGSAMLHTTNAVSAYEGVTPKIVVVEKGEMRFTRF